MYVQLSKSPGFFSRLYAKEHSLATRHHLDHASLIITIAAIVKYIFIIIIDRGHIFLNRENQIIPLQIHLGPKSAGHLCLNRENQITAIGSPRPKTCLKFIETRAIYIIFFLIDFSTC